MSGDDTGVCSQTGSALAAAPRRSAATAHLWAYLGGGVSLQYATARHRVNISSQHYNNNNNNNNSAHLLQENFVTHEKKYCEILKLDKSANDPEIL